MRLSPRCSAVLLMAVLTVACGKHGDRAPAANDRDDHPSAGEDHERGPHRGRLLRDGDFATEVTIFEEGGEPTFRVYAYASGKPVDPRAVKLGIELGRLGGQVDRFAFSPQQDYLQGNGVVAEPHSFDVRVVASHQGKTHRWAYASYEGRTTIANQTAAAAGVKSETAGSAEISTVIDLAGRVEIMPEGKSEIRAPYPGRILELRGLLGQTVRSGQNLARVESSHSLQAYAISAPIDGIIIEKNVNVGDVTGNQPLFVIADPSKLYAAFYIYPRDAASVRVGQTVLVRNLSGDVKTTTTVGSIIPTADHATQTTMAHVAIPQSAVAGFRPGMGVEGSFVTASDHVPLAVRTRAIQRFRDFEVVYAKVGDTYEVRMLDIGRRTPEWTEVLGGIAAGTEYVTDGAFLIRADIEKSGASHDH